MAAVKPKVLVLGGCGFVGRQVVCELVESRVCGAVCVVDKVPPQIAWLNARQTKLFADEGVSFRSANLFHPASCAAAFGEEEWDWVINAAAETKTGQVEEVYHEGIVRLSVNCASEAAKRKVKVYLEVSAGTMASNDKAGHKEGEECSPWRVAGRCKLEAEERIKALGDLNWIIVRPATVYGPSDRTGLTPRLVFGAVYRHLGEPMKMLWDKNLYVNTVHVKDVARAVVWLCQRERVHQTYNLVDDNCTTQGFITDLVSEIFDITHDYWGNTLSNVAKVDTQGLVAEINDKHLAPWAKLCAGAGLDNTPLTPYVDQDLVLHKHLHLNGTKLRAEGFTYSIPRPTKELLLEVLQDYVTMKLFPASALPTL